MPEIQLPTKALQESIKQDTSNIRTDLTSAHTKLNSIGTTLEEGLGTDWSEYTPFGKHGSYRPPSDVGYHTVFEVQGEGYISKAIMRHVSNSSYWIYWKVTLDGVAVYDRGATILPNMTGIVDKNHVHYDSGSYLTRVGTAGYAQLTNIDAVDILSRNQATSNAVMMLEQPLFFKQSLKVEMRYTSTVLLNVPYEIWGGVKV